MNYQQQQLAWALYPRCAAGPPSRIKSCVAPLKAIAQIDYDDTVIDATMRVRPSSGRTPKMRPTFVQTDNVSAARPRPLAREGGRTLPALWLSSGRGLHPLGPLPLQPSDQIRHSFSERAEG